MDKLDDNAPETSDDTSKPESPSLISAAEARSTALAAQEEGAQVLIDETLGLINAKVLDLVQKGQMSLDSRFPVKKAVSDSDNIRNAIQDALTIAGYSNPTVSTTDSDRSEIKVSVSWGE